MLISLHPENPNPRSLAIILECLSEGGTIIYPTDTIYGLGCDIFHHKAVEKINRIKNFQATKSMGSFVCSSLSDLSKYTKSISTPLYRILKSHLPGPYTFILPASKEVPKILKSKRDTIGLRIPANPITLALIKAVGNPLLSTSLPGEEVEDYTDPEIIYEIFKNEVDIVVNGGIGGIIPSTVIDCTREPYEVVRMGAGKWEEY
ncbi:MAG: threonylcarbamoyl-AMP synthase [Bacteroidetes bacterium]|nr:threonylcarbamoyl-AMP synthase [Bacteroidota bacterium]